MSKRANRIIRLALSVFIFGMLSAPAGAKTIYVPADFDTLQAGIDVVALIEAMPHVGGYKVHADKLKRHGVSIFTSHTVVSATGDERVNSVTIGELDESWNLIPGTYKTFEVDTVLIAVGLIMMTEVKKISWRDWSEAVPAAGTILVMVAMLTIHHGLAAGFILYPICKLLAGKLKEITWLNWVMALVCLGMVLLIFFTFK